MRSEQEGGEPGKGGRQEVAPAGQSFPARGAFMFNQVRGSSFCLGPPTASLPKCPVFSQIRSLGRAEDAVGVEVLLELKGGPVTRGTWLSAGSVFFPGAGYCRHLGILSQFSASPAYTWRVLYQPPCVTMETGASASIPELICEARRRLWVGVEGGGHIGRPKRERSQKSWRQGEISGWGGYSNNLFPAKRGTFLDRP